MRFGSAIPGLAAARQGQAEERPRLVRARLQRVSPLWTWMDDRAGADVGATPGAEIAMEEGKSKLAPG